MLLVVSNASEDEHDAGPGHPERPARSRAALDGLQRAGLDGALRFVAPRPASSDDLARVHTPVHLARLRTLDHDGGGRIDPDTRMSEGSLRTALAAAGAGLTAIEALDCGTDEAALVLVRPPGHHAGPARAMGFCLLNNVAVAAAALADRGERVAVLDWDVHHGNGTQDIFWDDPRVLFISLHQSGLYPGTGWVEEAGGPEALGATLNIPLPAGTTGDAIRSAAEQLVAPALARFRPTWILVSAGFDGHRADPLGGWELTAADYVDLADLVRQTVPVGRVMCFLEGGYDLDAVASSVGAVATALLGQPGSDERRSAGDRGLLQVDEIVAWQQRQPWSG